VRRLVERWRAVLEHPIVRLELRRIRRKRWWPGRRFFLFYPALLGAVLGCGVTVAFGPRPGAQLAALGSGVLGLCMLNSVTSLLAFALAWIVPALTATSLARERELGTLDLLRATLLTERAIVLGKLGGCLARLWPGVLALALLTPFQVVRTTGSILTPYPSALMLALVSGTRWSWAGLALAGVAGALRPWSGLAFHAAVGLFVSTWSRSSGASVAVSYGAIIVTRLGLSLVTSLLGVVLALLPSLEPGLPEAMWNGMLVMPSLVTLAAVLLESAGAALLVWGAIGWLKRT